MREGEKMNNGQKWTFELAVGRQEQNQRKN